MSLERIFQALVNLGLSEPDAQVYIYLALKGPKNAKTIVKSLEINQKQILDILKNLKEKGIISQDEEKKTKFIALPFEKALKLLIKTEKKQTRTIQKDLLHKWKAMMKKNSINSP